MCFRSMAQRYDKELRQIGQRVLALHEFPQPFFHRRAHEKVAEDINLAAKVLIRNRLDKFFGGADRQGLGSRLEAWRNSWRQWVLKKNMMR